MASTRTQWLPPSGGVTAAILGDVITSVFGQKDYLEVKGLFCYPDSSGFFFCKILLKSIEWGKSNSPPMNLRHLKWFTSIFFVLDLLCIAGWWYYPKEIVFPLLAIFLSGVLIALLVTLFLLGMSADKDEQKPFHF